MHELVPFKHDTPDIGSIALEKLTWKVINVLFYFKYLTSMSNIPYEIKSSRKFQDTMESYFSLINNAIFNSKPYLGFDNTNDIISRFTEHVLK